MLYSAILNPYLINWEEDTEMLHINYPDYLFLRFWTPGLLQGFIFWRCPVDYCGIIFKFDDKRRPVPKYRQCEPYPEILGEVTQERREKICRCCFEHMVREHPDEVPSDEDGISTGYARTLSNGQTHTNMFQPYVERVTPDDGDEYTIE